MVQKSPEIKMQADEEKECISLLSVTMTKSQRQANFIKKRDFFSSQLWRLKDMMLAPAQLKGQSHSEWQKRSHSKHEAREQFRGWTHSYNKHSF